MERNATRKDETEKKAWLYAGKVDSDLNLFEEKLRSLNEFVEKKEGYNVIARTCDHPDDPDDLARPTIAEIFKRAWVGDFDILIIPSMDQISKIESSRCCFEIMMKHSNVEIIALDS